jgi:predicted alpha/beta hydrolase
MPEKVSSYSSLPVGLAPELSAYYAKDNLTAVKGVIVFGAAMGVPGRYYQALAEYFNEQGWHCYLVSSRAEQGKGARRGVNFGYKELIDDFSVVVKTAAQNHKSLPLIVSGHSLGGQIALLFTSRNPALVSAVATIACGSPYVEGFNAKMARQVQWVCLLAPVLGFLLGYFPGDKLGFAGREAPRLMSDWATLARHNQFAISGDDFNYEAAISALRIPVVGLVFPGDNLAPLLAAENLLAKLGEPRYSLLVHEPSESEKAYSHFNWVKRPQQSLIKLMPWLDQLIKIR